jgi:NAD(P)-dependent dehydrogenase (short-subunit alcohol dehydrogenase family)
MNIKLEVNLSTGHEEMFQVNYLSTALLALLLLPILKNTPSGTPGRLTLVASGAALIAEFSERNEVLLLPAFDKQEGWSSSVAKKRYDTTKGLVLMLTLKLSKITKAENTVINVVDPTFTPGTSFFRNLPFIIRVFTWPLTALFGTSVNNAAWRYIDAAVHRGKESHGSFLSDWEIHPYVTYHSISPNSLTVARLIHTNLD